MARVVFGKKGWNSNKSVAEQRNDITMHKHFPLFPLFLMDGFFEFLLSKKPA